MSETIDFYFDFGSPTAYLAYRRLLWIADHHAVSVNPIPVLLGGIFKATGNRSPVENPAKGAWMVSDLARYADLYEVPMQFNPHFPINTIYLMRGAVYAQQQGFLPAYMAAVYQAMWVEEKNLADPEVVAEVLTAAGMDAKALLSGIDAAEVKDALRDNTDKAVALGHFGCPTMVFREQMFFGQDRLFFIERMLAAGA